MCCYQKRNCFLLCVYVLMMPLWMTKSWSFKMAKKKNMCIIGAGMSGLASARIVTKHLNTLHLVVFEKNSDVGGQWLYTDRTNLDEHGLPVHSSVWKNMKTNALLRWMQYPDYDILGEYNEDGADDEEEDLVLHEKVLEYLRDYARHFDLRRFIRFNTLVTMVSPIYDKKTQNGKVRWLVATKDFNLNSTSKVVCDVVMVCNGHLSKPRMPVIIGLETYPGEVIHSHNYRRPEKYTGKTVLVLGAKDSGVGISEDLANHAEKIYLSHRRKLSFKLSSKKIIEVAGVVMAEGQSLILSDASTLQDTDAMILCTGYVADLSFLDPAIGVNVTDAQSGYVSPLRNRLFHVDYPTLAFIGLYDAAINHYAYEQIEEVLNAVLDS